MRNIKPEALSKIIENNGVEPYNFIEIFWNKNHYNDDNTSTIYSDSNGLLELGPIDNTINVTGNSTSQSVTIVLDDENGDIANILGSRNIHKVPVKIYQGFRGLSQEHAFLLFEGVIVTPIIYSNRSLTFEVMTDTVSVEIGFTADMGDIENNSFF